MKVLFSEGHPHGKAKGRRQKAKSVERAAAAINSARKMMATF
jgi:hypothetical protein